MMIRRFRGILFVLGCMGLSNAALAAGAPEPTDPFANLFSASVTIGGMGGEPQGVLANIPAGQTFILTQFCVGGNGGPGFNPALRGSSFGGIPSSSQGGCTSYSPGVLLKGEQSISCSLTMSSFEGIPCMITGYKRRG